MIARRARGAILVLAAAGLAACDAGPKSGQLTFELTAPLGNTGAVVFSVLGVAPLAVQGVVPACVGCQVFMTSLTDQELRGVVIGPLTTGPLVHVTVSDIRRPEAYTAEIREVAANDHTLLAATGYTLALPR